MATLFATVRPQCLSQFHFTFGKAGPISGYGLYGGERRRWGWGGVWPWFVLWVWTFWVAMLRALLGPGGDNQGHREPPLRRITPSHAPPRALTVTAAQQMKTVTILYYLLLTDIPVCMLNDMLLFCMMKQQEKTVPVSLKYKICPIERKGWRNDHLVMYLNEADIAESLIIKWDQTVIFNIYIWCRMKRYRGSYSI